MSPRGVTLGNAFSLMVNVNTSIQHLVVHACTCVGKPNTIGFI